jgi:hypothetical protein
MSERLKQEIRRRLLEYRYPRRGAARVAKAEDHNPQILEDCPTCHGRGEVCKEAPGLAWQETCPACEGTGTTFNVVPYFTNDSPPVSVRADAEGWLTCPTCGYRFSTRDRHVWSGWRHMRCGQRIALD